MIRLLHRLSWPGELKKIITRVSRSTKRILELLSQLTNPNLLQHSPILQPHYDSWEFGKQRSFKRTLETVCLVSSWKLKVLFRWVIFEKNKKWWYYFIKSSKQSATRYLGIAPSNHWKTQLNSSYQGTMTHQTKIKRPQELRFEWRRDKRASIWRTSWQYFHKPCLRNFNK